MTATSDGGIWSIVPYGSYTAYTPALPQFYWDVYSAEQRIKSICLEIDKLVHYSNYLASELNKAEYVTPDDLQELSDTIDARLADLESEIKALVGTTLVWDVQHGNLQPSTTAMRDMFNDVTVHAITVEQLSELDVTVESLANCGLNVRGLAVMSYWLVERFSLPDGFSPKQESATSILTTNQLNVASVDANTGNIFIPKEFRS